MNGFTGHYGCLPDCLCHMKALKRFGYQSGWVPCECLIVTKSHGGESDLSLFSLHELTAQFGSILWIGHNLFSAEQRPYIREVFSLCMQPHILDFSVFKHNPVLSLDSLYTFALC